MTAPAGPLARARSGDHLPGPLGKVVAPERESDERYTPPWMAALVHEFFGGDCFLDVCTSATNPMGAEWEYIGAEGRDGLVAPWYVANGKVWCNPPYSRGQVIRWARKAIKEARDGAQILMLTQADVSTGWFRLLRENCDGVCLLHKRVGFLKPDGTQMLGAKFGSALWHFGDRRPRFRRVFEPHGWIIEGPGQQEVSP